MTHVTHALVETPQELKARGAFYTPPELTEFLARWAVRAAHDRVLEPSCGDGAFVSALVSRYDELGEVRLDDRLLGIEREGREAAKARDLAPHADIRQIDFFDLEPAGVAPVDAVIGNPPYIRYHGFSGTDRERARSRARQQGVELSRLASSWAHFVIHSAAFLKASGRMALVLPAELLHTDYGRPVREFLLRRFSSVVVVAFDALVFRDAQVDAVLLLASEDDMAGLRVVRVPSLSELGTFQILTPVGIRSPHRPVRWSASIDVDADEVYRNAIELYSPQRLGDYARVDIGFVSGANDFFVLDDLEVERWQLPHRVLTPVVRRPSDVPGLVVRRGEQRWLLDLAGAGDLEREVRSYISYGESLGIQAKYKCRVRQPWYAVPLPKHAASAFLPYMTHVGPRLVVNPRAARSSNLLHGVALSEGAPSIRAIAVAAASSLTLLSAEVEGRAYGGGVLKLETREAERLVIPRISEDVVESLEQALISTDRMVRAGDVKGAAREVDAILGLDHGRLWGAYLTYRNRRLGRRRSSDGRGRPPAVAQHSP